jgi:hypothetical protein
MSSKIINATFNSGFERIGEQILGFAFHNCDE